jgi:GNAT superfamily N-acetyltransferase
MSVLADGLLGLFDLVTAPNRRNRGYGSALLRRTLLWGARLGAEEAYLQVLEGNAAAERIYDRAGFEIVYRYHYRELI